MKVVVEHIVNSLNDTEFYTLKWLILCNVTFNIIFINLVSTFNPRIYLYFPEQH